MERRPASPDPAAAVALVLGNDDLLLQILLCLDSQTSLVRAAAVCRRWLRRASDPAFLRRFRALRPPRVLGLHVHTGTYPPRYFAVLQPRGLAAASRRASRAISPHLRLGGARFWDCRNGRVLVGISDNVHVVRSFLNQVPDVTIPPAPTPISFCPCKYMFLLEDDGDVTSCLSLTVSIRLKTVNSVEVLAEFSILQSGVWGVLQRAKTQLEMGLALQFKRSAKLVVGKRVYMLTDSFILGLDLATNIFFTIELPDGPGNNKLSRAQQSGLYLIKAKEFELRVWHGDGAGQWVLVDTFSVREACGHLNVPKWEPDDGCDPIWVVQAGDNAEFVFLQLMASEILCCMQLGKRTAERVHGAIPPSGYIFMHPISMVWPPRFPTLHQEYVILEALTLHL